MKSFLGILPNLLSACRVALVPLLWVLAVRGDTAAVGFGLVVAGITDVLDGQLARRLDAATPAGAALDSLGDNLLALSAAVWLVMLRPDVAARFAAPLAIWLALYACFLGLGVIKFRRFANLHLYSSKAAAVVGYVFVTSCFLFPGVPVALGWLAFVTAVAAVVEGLICQVVARTIDEHAGSVVRVLRNRKSGRRKAARASADVGRAA